MLFLLLISFKISHASYESSFGPSPWLAEQPSNAYEYQPPAIFSPLPNQAFSLYAVEFIPITLTSPAFSSSRDSTLSPMAQDFIPSSRLLLSSESLGRARQRPESTEILASSRSRSGSPEPFMFHPQSPFHLGSISAVSSIAPLVQSKASISGSSVSPEPFEFHTQSTSHPVILIDEALKEEEKTKIYIEDKIQATMRQIEILDRGVKELQIRLKNIQHFKKEKGKNKKTWERTYTTLKNLMAKKKGEEEFCEKLRKRKAETITNFVK